MVYALSRSGRVSGNNDDVVGALSANGFVRQGEALPASMQGLARGAATAPRPPLA